MADDTFSLGSLLVRRQQAGEKEEYYVYDPAVDAVHVLNATAFLVLESLTRGVDPGRIAERLREGFSMPGKADPQADVNRMIQRLADLGLFGG